MTPSAASWPGKMKLHPRIWDSPSNTLYHALSRIHFGSVPPRQGHSGLRSNGRMTRVGFCRVRPTTRHPLLSHHRSVPARPGKWKYALRFKFCRGTNCLTDRIFDVRRAGSGPIKKPLFAFSFFQFSLSFSISLYVFLSFYPTRIFIVLFRSSSSLFGVDRSHNGEVRLNFKTTKIFTVINFIKIFRKDR